MLSGVGDILWVDPASIRFKISPVHDLHGTVAGDWDIDRRHPFQSTAKYRAMVQRYIERRPWIDTDLFTDAYRRRLERDGRIGRSTTLAELAKDYERRFDGLAVQLRRDGFQIKNDRGKPYPLPTLLIGRDGEVMIGNQGNHRLALAQVFGLDRIAGRVVCRHSQTCR